MSDPSQQCPYASAWREYNTSGVRTKPCGRLIKSTESCAAITIIQFINHQYIRVCGRVIGYHDQVGSPHAFSHTRITNEIGLLLDAISITCGTHIWSYVMCIRDARKFACHLIVVCVQASRLGCPHN